MIKKNRSSIIFDKYKKLTKIWQFFFTGWGLLMVASLVAGALFTKQLAWTKISFIDINDIINNQLTVIDASFSGLDKNKEPFNIKFSKLYREHDKPDILFIENIKGSVVRFDKDKKISNKISATRGKYLIKEKRIIFSGDVKVISDNGDKLFTKELIIKL